MVMITWNFSFLGVLIAAIASMILGMLWYHPAIFGNLWMKLSGKTIKDREAQKKKGMTAQMIAAFLGNIITAFALSMIFQIAGVSSIGGAWALGVVIWVGFLLTTTMNPVLWEGQKLGLYMLNNFYNLINILLMSAIVTYW